jgi:GNAT superfamily N-acetyltransferase
VEAILPELLDPNRDAAKIRAIFIHPEFARMGLGGAILKHAEQAAAREGFRRFEMGSTLAGVPLYVRKGYRRREEIDVPVGDGRSISIVRMDKSLNDLEQQQKQHDGEEKANRSATIVADPRTHAISAKAEEQD